MFSCLSATEIVEDSTAENNKNVAAADYSESQTDFALAFNEIWGYVMIGREKEFSNDYPITDVGYFISAVNEYGHIPLPKTKEEVFPDYKGKVHIVTSCDSKGQTHLLLEPKSKARKTIIDELIKAAETYDGLQIDWELVPKNDDKNFFDFLTILKKKLKGKPLTVAIPARLKTLEKDPYDYARLSTIADKIIVMAYDQHWSTSAPGPIASPDWGVKILNYAKTVIPEEKFIMGAPLYSRAWTNENIGGRAWINRSVERLIKENNVSQKDIKSDSEGNKYFKLKKERTITVYFDDTETSTARLSKYKEEGINRVAFWRVGQENEDFWKKLKAE